MVLACVLVAACSAGDNGGAVGAPAGPRPTSGPPGALRDRLPAEISSAGVLRIGGAVGRAPLLFYGTGTTQLEGLDYDIVQAMARQLGVAVTVTDEPLTMLGPDVLAGRIDALMSGFVDVKTFEHAGIDFVDYLTGRSSVLVRPGDPTHVHGPDGLCGRTVGVLAGTAQQVATSHLDDACRTRGRPLIVARTGDDHAAMVRSLLDGKLDAVLDDAVVAEYTAQSSTGHDIVEVVGAAVDPMPYGIGVASSNGTLRDAIQAALRAVIADGSYDAALLRWGGAEAALRTAPVNAGA